MNSTAAACNSRGFDIDKSAEKRLMKEERGGGGGDKVPPQKSVDIGGAVIAGKFLIK